MNIPYISLEQVKDVNVKAQEYGLTLTQMAENSGSAIADILAQMVDSDAPVVFLVGKGGNGASALVVARFLVNRGHEVRIVMTRSDGYLPETERNLQIIKKMGVAVFSVDQLANVPRPGIVVDGILGAGLHGVAQGAEKACIEWANDQSCLVLAIDMPSGMDTTHGVYADTVIRADVTVSQGLPNTGLTKPNTRQYTGIVRAVDNGIPLECYREAGVEIEDFRFTSQIMNVGS